MKPYFICDLGSCHQNNFEETKSFINGLNIAGVDAIKFQYWSDPEAFAVARHHPELMEQYFKWGTDLEFLKKMQEVAINEEMDFICSVFLEKDVEVIAPYVDHFKIASLEAKDRKLLYEVDRYSFGKDILVSTGCTTQDDMQYFNALRENRLTQKLHSRVQLLHCISSYPAEPKEMNLKSLQNNRLDGLSDHSCNWIAPVVALAFGARIFEFHGRLDETPEECPDERHSMTLGLIEEYVGAVIAAQEMFGSPLREITEGEQALISYRRET